MYACIPDIGGGFFQGVCTPSNAPVNFRDPPLSAKELEPWQWGAGPKRITRRATVDETLA